MSNALWTVAVLACPIGMGVMTWMMSRGHSGHSDSSADAGSRDEVAALILRPVLRCRARRPGTALPPRAAASPIPAEQPPSSAMGVRVLWPHSITTGAVNACGDEKAMAPAGA